VIALVAALVVAGLGFVVMSLWNGLIPSLFGGPTLRFWQAVGLLLLSRILVGGFRGRGGHGHWRHRMWARRWEEHMTPEERARFRDGFKRWEYMTPEERASFRSGFRSWCRSSPLEEGKTTTQPKP
jgi:hypothetical protein